LGAKLAIVAEYLEFRTRLLTHPESTIKKISAALNALFKPLGILAMDDIQYS